MEESPFGLVLTLPVQRHWAVRMPVRGCAWLYVVACSYLLQPPSHNFFSALFITELRRRGVSAIDPVHRALELRHLLAGGGGLQ